MTRHVQMHRALITLVAMSLFGLAASSCVPVPGKSEVVVSYNLGNGYVTGGHHVPKDGQLDISGLVTNGARPLVIALQEVCGESYNYILDRIHQFGYNGTFFGENDGPSYTNGGCDYRSDGDRDRNGGRGWGNAVFFRGVEANGGSAHTKVQFAHQQSDHPHRVAGCTGFGVDGSAKVAYACTAHLDNDASTAQLQAGDLANWLDALNDFFAGPPMVIGMDTNLTPTSDGMTGFAWLTYPRYHSVDSVPPRATLPSGRTIDYLFVSDTVFRTAGVTTAAGRSDHYLLSGSITWK